MKLLRALAIVCFLAQVLNTVDARRRKSRAGKKDWRMVKLQRMMSPMQEDIKELQDLVESLSNPVHIHLHSSAKLDSSAMEQSRQHREEKDHKNHGGHGNRKHHQHDEGKMKCEKCKQHGSDGNEHGMKNQSNDDHHHHRHRHNRNVHIHLNVRASDDDGKESCGSESEEYPSNEYRYGCCNVSPNLDLRTDHVMKGNVYLRQKPHGQIEVKVDLRDYGKTVGRSVHGFHVHEFADLGRGCQFFGGHFNPGGHKHGGPDVEHKHHGDWGNLEAQDGVIQSTFNAPGTLFGRESMIGRGIVIHAGPDDLGKGGNHESETTGSAGGRIACCAITLCKGEISSWK